MNKEQALKNYKQLTDKVDAKFDEIFNKHKDQFSCTKGCYSCCKPDLSVSQIEALNIREHIKNNLVDLSLDKGIPGYCEFLSEKGECLIYEARPVICRSHGAPVAYKDEFKIQQKDVCELNFKELPIQDLSDQDFFNLDTVNVLLAVMNQVAGFDDQRIPLVRTRFLDKQA